MLKFQKPTWYVDWNTSLKDYAYDLNTQRSALHAAFFFLGIRAYKELELFFHIRKVLPACVRSPHESLHQGSIFFNTCVCTHTYEHACAWWHCFWCSWWSLGHHSLKFMVAYCTLPWPITFCQELVGNLTGTAMPIHFMIVGDGYKICDFTQGLTYHLVCSLGKWVDSFKTFQWGLSIKMALNQWTGKGDVSLSYYECLQAWQIAQWLIVLAVL